MNVITCAALMSLNLEFFAHDKRIMFGICFILCLIGLIFQRSFKKLIAESKTGTGNSSSKPEVVAKSSATSGGATIASAKSSLFDDDSDSEDDIFSLASKANDK